MNETQLQEQRENRAKLIADCRKILDKAASENGRDLTSAENATYDRMFADAEKSGVEIDRWASQLSAEREMSASRGRQSDPGDPNQLEPPVSGRRVRQTEAAGYTFRDLKSGKEIRALRSNEQLAATVPDARESDGEISVGKILLSMMTGRLDQLSESERRVALGGTDVSGGYLLTPTLGAKVIDLARSASVTLKAGAQTIPMESAELVLARITGDPTAVWRAEGVAITASQPTFGRVTLRPKTIAAIIPASIELLEDAANAASMIEQVLRRTLGAEMDRVILDGTGAAAEPEGISQNSDINTVAVGGAPDYANFTDAVGEILQDNFPGEITELAAILHPRDEETLMNLLDTTNQPLRPPSWYTDLRRFRTTSLPTTGGGGGDSIAIVGDFSQVLIGVRTSGIIIEVLREGSVTDGDGNTQNASTQLLRHIRAYMRVDHVLLQPSWFTSLTGITT